MQDGSADSFQELLEAIKSPSSLFEFDPNVFQAALVGKLDVIEVACHSVPKLAPRAVFHHHFKHCHHHLLFYESLELGTQSANVCGIFFSLKSFMSCSSQHLRSHMPGL